jgi:hypothetical protein
MLFPNDPKRRGYYSWEDEQAIAAKSQWLRSNGYAGVIVWMTSYGNINKNTNENPFMAAIKENLFGPMPINIRLTPNPVKLNAGQSQQFSVRELTGTDNKDVTWSVVESGGGTISSTGLYTAPSEPGLYHVRVTSVADTRRYADAAVTVDGFRVNVDPAYAKVSMGQSQPFSPVYVNGADSLGVTWSVVENGGGSISPSGLYTAPSAPGTYHVRATSNSGRFCSRHGRGLRTCTGLPSDHTCEGTP